VDREAEGTAFAKACAFLKFHPVALWTAYVAAAAAGVVYVALLGVLWLFADLMVSRGRLPTYHDAPAAAQDHFVQEWLPPSDEEPAPPAAGLVVGPAGVAAAGPALSPLSDAAKEREVRYEQAGLDKERSVRAAVRREGEPPDPVALDKIWRAYLAHILQERLGLPEENLRDNMLAHDDYHEVDHGALSLVVRTHLHGDFSAPVVAWVARWNPWLWNLNTDPRWVFPWHLTGLLGVALLLGLLNTGAALLMRDAAARATTGAATRFRRAVYHHTFRLGTLAFRALGPTEAVSVFTRHVEAVHDALYTRLTVYFREPIKFGLLLLFALVVNTPLALAFMLFAALLWMVGGQISAYFRRQARVATNLAGERLTIIRESLMLMRLVKCYLMEQFNQSRVERQLSRYSQVQLIRLRGEAVAGPILLLLGFLSAAILLYVAGLIVLSGTLSVAGMAVLATALLSMYRPAQKWLESRKALRRGRESAVHLFKFLERRGEVGQVVGAEFLPPLADRIEFDNVSLREPGGSRMLLEGVSLTLPAGKRIGLIGADDLEKHALVYLIPRLLDPTAGEIRIDKHNVRWVTLDSLRAQIAVVLQNNLVFHDTVANNIGCGDAAYTLPRIIEAAKLAHAHHFIQKLPQGYETPIGELGHALGVGEQYRIALARAILRDPALLIIEEPEAALDDDTKALLDDTLARVLPGRTCIFLPHRISTIRSCDRLFLINKGRVVASGVHKELLAQNPLYRHLHYLEFNEMVEQV
jgi:ATP-binding cassette, subfamily B, bacterial